MTKSNLYHLLLIASCIILLTHQVESQCNFVDVTPSIIGIVNDTITDVKCGVEDCENSGYDPATLYFAFEDQNLTNFHPSPCDNIDCDDDRCYRTCSLQLKKIMDEKKLYCFVRGSPESRSSLPVKKSSEIPIRVQSSLGSVYDFTSVLNMSKESTLIASWKPPSDVLDGIIITFKVTYEAPHSPHLDCSPKFETTDSTEITIEIRYEDTCDYSIVYIQPIAIANVEDANLNGLISSYFIENSLSDSLIDNSTEIQLFLQNNENATVLIRFKEAWDVCFCPTRKPTSAEFRYKLEVGKDDIQTALVEEDDCYGLIKANSLIYPRKKKIQLEVNLKNQGGKITRQSHQIQFSTFDSQRAHFSETGTTQCITIEYANEIAENPVIIGSEIIFNSLTDEPKQKSVKITKPHNKDSVTDCHLSLLYNGAYVMCVADYNEEECAIQQTIVVASNPSPSPSSTTITSTSTITITSVSTTTTSVIVKETCDSDTGKDIGEGIGIGSVFWLLILIIISITAIVFVVTVIQPHIRKGNNRIADIWNKLKAYLENTN